MNELLEQLTPYLITIATIILGYVATKIKSFIDSKIAKDKQEEITAIVKATVSYVEQVAPILKITGSDKLALAKEKALSWLADKGLTISDTELDILIESFVNGLEGK